MHFIILSILSVTLVFILFKLFGQYRLNITLVILVSYGVSFLFSSVFISPDLSFSLLIIKWLPLLLITAGLFIFNLYLLGFCSAEFGVAITSVANKLSLAIPVIFSIIIDPNDNFTIPKTIGILLSLIAIVFLLFPDSRQKIAWRKIFLLIALFLGIGFSDSLLKYAQFSFLNDNTLSLYVALIFACCFIYAFFISFFKVKQSDLLLLKNWIGGVLLGVVNWAAIITLMLALSYSVSLPGSIVFGINNLGIVFMSVIAGSIFFKEKLTSINYIGIILSVLAILLLTVYL